MHRDFQIAKNSCDININKNPSILHYPQPSIGSLKYILRIKYAQNTSYAFVDITDTTYVRTIDTFYYWGKCKYPGPLLIHWGRDKMATIFQTTFSNAFFFNDKVKILIKISLKFVPKGPINNIPALIQIMAWRWPGDKPLSAPMMVSLLTHICVTRPQWVKGKSPYWYRDSHNKTETDVRPSSFRHRGPELCKLI